MSQNRNPGGAAARLLLAVGAAALLVGLLTVPVVVGARFADRPWALLWRVLVVVLAALVLAVLARRLLPTQPRRIVLDLDLTKRLPEETDGSPIGALRSKGTVTVRDVVQGLARAARDRRVVGVFARMGDASLGPGVADEVRDAVIAFRESGKRAVVFADTLGEVRGATGLYYVATGFDEIVLQPSGEVGLTGLFSVSPFLRSALDKAGIDPRMDHRHEYKSAKNMFTETGFTPPHRESVEALLDSVYDRTVSGIASARGLEPHAVRALIDRGPLLAHEALEAGLLDRLAYRDEIVDDVIGEGRGKPKAIHFAKWWKRAKKRQRGTSVALVYGVGQIIRGKSRYALPSGKSMGGDTVAAAIRDARKDKKVKAILLRVDSPGGSAVASDTVWREVVKAKEEGKPVVVSMGDVAGSGGYWISMAADKIVAQPGTITGSIGVVSGKMVSTGLLEKVGVSTGTVGRGANAAMFSSVEDFTPEGWQRLQDGLDRIYDDFVTKVAEGRGMTREAVHEVAKGRVWSGADALERGLVDELGGFPVALRLVREAADLRPDAPVKLKVFPKKKGPLGFLNRGEDPAGELAVVPPVLSELYELAAAAMPSGVASMPPGLRSLWR